MSADFTAIISNGLASIKAMASGAASGLDKMAGGLKRTGEAAKNAEKHMRDLGAAVARMGGPVGEIGGKFFGAAGMSGGIRTLALAAVGAGVAFKTFTSIMEAATARAQAFAEAAAGIRGALRSASEAQRGFAAGSVETGKLQARAENIFGADAGGRAQMLGQAFGVDAKDIMGAMAGAGGLKANQRAAALEAAAAAAATGEMTATEAMGMLSDPVARAAVLGQQSGGGLSAAQRGAAQLIMRNRGARGPDALREALDTVGASGPARGQLRGVARAGNLVTAGQQNAFTSGQAETALRTEAARTLNPLAAAMSDMYATQQEAAQKLMDAAKAAGFVIEVIKEVGGAVGLGGGSSEGQARRVAIAFGKAVKGMQ